MSVQLDSMPRRLVSESSRSGDGTVTIISPTGDIVSLNPVAGALWDLCDGGTTVAEIVAAATTLFAASPDSIKHDIEGALEALQEQHLIEA